MSNALAKADAALAKRRQESLQQKQDDIAEEAFSVVHGALSWAQLAEDAEGPPDLWLKELGHEGAWERFRVARAAQMSTRDAPVGLKLAFDFARAVMASGRAAESAPQLNVAIRVTPTGDRSMDDTPYDVIDTEIE